MRSLARSSSRDANGEDVCVSEQLFFNLLCLGSVALEENIGHACLSLFEDNVLQLLYVPAGCCEDLEAVGQHANFVQVSHLNLTHGCIVGHSSVHPVELVNLTFYIEFLDDSDGLLTYCGFSLLSARTAVVSTVDARMLSDRVSEVVSLLHRWLAKVDICANPEVRARLELCKESLFINDITTCCVNQHAVFFHLTKEFSIDHILCLRSGWCVQAHNIGTCQKLILAHISEAQLFIEACLLGSCADEHFHLEGTGSLAHQLANVTETNQANCAAFDTSAIGEHTLVPMTAFKHIDSFRHTSVDRQDEAHRKLRDSVGILAWAIGHVDALCRAVCEVDCIVASACSDYKLQVLIGINDGLRHFGGANN